MAVNRVTFVDTKPDEEAFDPIVLDLVLDDEGNVKAQAPAVGWWGLYCPGDDFLPFVLRPDGRLDFGSEYELYEDRFGRCNIFDRQIRRGEYVTFWLEGEEICMRVKELTALG